MLTLPNFFIVGAPKTGTTSLYHYLAQHPQVCMSAIKEPHYFASEIREANVAPHRRRAIAEEHAGAQAFLAGSMAEPRFGGIIDNWTQYLRLFSHSTTEPAIGEASVCYLWSPSAAKNIAEALPHSRIVIMLRDPADRSFSQYLHGRSHGAISGTFRQHFDECLAHQSSQLSEHHPFLEFGLYDEQIRRYRDRFEHVWIGFHEEFEAAPLAVLRDLFRFLGIDSAFIPDISRRHLELQVPRNSAVGSLKASGLWQAAAKLAPAALRHRVRKIAHHSEPLRPDPADRRRLIHYYRPSITALESTLDRDLSHWLV